MLDNDWTFPDDILWDKYNEGKIAAESCTDPTSKGDNPYSKETLEGWSWGCGWNRNY